MDEERRCGCGESGAPILMGDRARAAGGNHASQGSPGRGREGCLSRDGEQVVSIKADM